jgi:hypothetical protein
MSWRTPKSLNALTRFRKSEKNLGEQLRASMNPEEH